jgi:DNA polymerase-1
MVKTVSCLKELIAKAGSGECALDFETTALWPSEGRVRLVSLYNGANVKALVDFDAIPGGFPAVAKLFETSAKWVVFNSKFEYRWFMAAGSNPILYDLKYLRDAIVGGANLSLKLLLEWDLNRKISKEEQASNWGAKRLTASQLLYAFEDSLHTWDAWQHWRAQTDEGHSKAFHLLNDMVPAVLEMEDAGMLLDQKRHQEMANNWAEYRATLTTQLREFVSEDAVKNINSDTQWSDYFSQLLPDHFLRAWPTTEKTGLLSMKGSVLRGVAALAPDTPLAAFLDTLASYKKISKYVSSFGETLITSAQLSKDGRVRARYNIAAARTCRFSSSGPNLQQIPRDQLDFFGEFMSMRQSFIAGQGRRLVSLDYSGIELRVLALLTGDEQLLYDVTEGDVHLAVGEYMAGRKLDKKIPDDKEIRSRAKGVSFGIVYGSGAGGLAITLRTGISRAQDLIDFWARRYPRAFELRNDMMREAAETKYIRMVDGGTIYMGKRPELPKCANYPVQRGALSIMARAISRHKDSLDAARIKGKQQQTRMLATIHDALIDETSTRDAKACFKMMEQDMIAGYLDVFPGAPVTNLVEGGVGTNWGTLD